MFWKREVSESLSVPGANSADFAGTGDLLGPIRVHPGNPRPAGILKVAGELERRGNEIVELFEEVEYTDFRLVVPIHFRQGNEDHFAEVETGPWDADAAERVLGLAFALRNSSYAASRLELFSAHPVPEEVSFLIGPSPAASFQLDLLDTRTGEPESLAENFKQIAENHWGTEFDYGPECLPLAEELLLTAMNEGEEAAFVTDALVEGLGCYLGEVVRHNAPGPGSWQAASDWGEEHILEFERVSLDPIGKARAFLNQGKEDSISYYVGYVLEALSSTGESQG